MNRMGHFRAEVSLDDDFAIEYKGSDPLAAYTLALRSLLERLDERHRLPLVLFYFQDLSYREISQASLERHHDVRGSRHSHHGDPLRNEATTDAARQRAGSAEACGYLQAQFLPL